MKKLFLLGAISISSLIFSQNQKQEKIKELTNLIGLANLMDTIINQTIEEVPELPIEFWQEIRKEFNPTFVDELMVSIYEKHFTEKEIDDIITFYRTDTGKKLIEKLPIITHEAQKIGQELGEKVGKKVLKKLKEDYGYDIPDEALQ